MNIDLWQLWFHWFIDFTQYVFANNCNQNTELQLFFHKGLQFQMQLQILSFFAQSSSTQWWHRCDKGLPMDSRRDIISVLSWGTFRLIFITIDKTLQYLLFMEQNILMLNSTCMYVVFRYICNCREASIFSTLCPVYSDAIWYERLLVFLFSFSWIPKSPCGQVSVTFRLDQDHQMNAFYWREVCSRTQLPGLYFYVLKRENISVR